MAWMLPAAVAGSAVIGGIMGNKAANKANATNERIASEDRAAAAKQNEMTRTEGRINPFMRSTYDPLTNTRTEAPTELGQRQIDAQDRVTGIHSSSIGQLGTLKSNALQRALGTRDLTGGEYAGRQKTAAMAGLRESSDRTDKAITQAMTRMGNTRGIADSLRDLEKPRQASLQDIFAQIDVDPEMAAAQRNASLRSIPLGEASGIDALLATAAGNPVTSMGFSPQVQPYQGMNYRAAPNNSYAEAIPAGALTAANIFTGQQAADRSADLTRQLIASINGQGRGGTVNPYLGNSSVNPFANYNYGRGEPGV